MYCKNCNAYNDDGSRFCCQCGAELEAPAAQSEPDFSSSQNGGYSSQYSAPQSEEPNYGQSQYAQTGYTQQNYAQPNYSQPNYGAASVEPTEPLNNTKAIVAIVLNIVIFNVIGLIFAILSLTNYNSYESALRAGNIALSEQLKAKSKKYSKIAFIFAIVMAVLAVVAGIVSFIVVFFVMGRATDLDPAYSYDFGYEDFMMLAPYFG